MKIEIKLWRWLFKFEMGLIQRPYEDIARAHGWLIDLPSPGQPNLRFIKYTGTSLVGEGFRTGHMLDLEISNTENWEELCKEQNLK